MKDNFDDHSEDLELINRFEQMLGSSEPAFFDLNDFEYIIDHYTANFDYKKAIIACDSARCMSRFPRLGSPADRAAREREANPSCFVKQIAL